MKLLSRLTIAAALFAAAPAHAQRIDLATYKCKDFIAGSKENVELILMWLQAYYSEENASPIVDFGKMRDDGGKIAEICRNNPNTSVIDAADEVLDKP